MLAAHLLSLELRLAEEPSMKTLEELVEGYSTAIERSEEAQDSTYVLYKERLQNVLRRKDVVSLYDTSGALSDRLESSNIISFAEREPSLPISEGRRIDGLIAKAEGVRLAAKRAAKDVERQKQTVLSRLKDRKERRSVIRVADFSESDAGAGRSSTFEQDLERLLESHIRLLSEAEVAINDKVAPEALIQARNDAEKKKRTEIAKLKAKYRI